jgi:hypothetical protein
MEISNDLELSAAASRTNRFIIARVEFHAVLMEISNDRKMASFACSA